MRTLRLLDTSSGGAMLGAAVAGVVACNSTESDGTGSETHFACKADEDCERYGAGLVCRDELCVEDVAGTGGGGNSDVDGGDGGSEPSSSGGAGGHSEVMAYPILERLCGSISLGALVAASEALIDAADKRRVLVAQSCAGLTGQAAPPEPTNDDVARICDEVLTMVDNRAVDTIATGACAVDALAQFDCEDQVATGEGCVCDEMTIENRCTPSYLSSTCAGACEGRCSVECSDGACAEPGSCEGTCFGECTEVATDVACSHELLALSCDCQAGQDGFNRCGDIGVFRVECAPFQVLVPNNVSGEGAALLQEHLPALIETSTVGPLPDSPKRTRSWHGFALPCPLRGLLRSLACQIAATTAVTPPSGSRDAGHSARRSEPAPREQAPGNPTRESSLARPAASASRRNGR